MGTLSGSWMALNSAVGQPLAPMTEELLLGAMLAAISRFKVPHMLCDASGRWYRSNVEPHTPIGLYLSVCESTYEHLQLPRPRSSGSTQVSAMVDTGAQMCVADVKLAGKLGLPEQLLVTLAMNVTALITLSCGLSGRVCHAGGRERDGVPPNGVLCTRCR